MKKVLGIAAVLVLVTGAAYAKDMTGKMGVGANGSLTGAPPTLGFTYWATGELGIDANLLVNYVSPKSGDAPMTIGFGVGARYNMARAQDDNLGVGLKIDIANLNDAAATPAPVAGQPAVKGKGYTDFSFAIPITAEHFFSDHFAIMLSTGIKFHMVPKDGNAFGDGDPESKVINIGGGDLFGEGGFRFYF
jgi:hypothetical protein